MHGDLDRGDTFPVDRLVDDASVDEFDGLLLPGGALNPDDLRQDERAVAFVRDWFGRASPWGSSATGRGPSWRPTSCAAGP